MCIVTPAAEQRMFAFSAREEWHVWRSSIMAEGFLSTFSETVKRRALACAAWKSAFAILAASSKSCPRTEAQKLWPGFPRRKLRRVAVVVVIQWREGTTDGLLIPVQAMSFGGTKQCSKSRTA